MRSWLAQLAVVVPDIIQNTKFVQQSSALEGGKEKKEIPAMDHALATVELLELILLGLDTQTLLTAARRVCKFWNDVVQESAQLQAALFFRPVAVVPGIPARDDQAGLHAFLSTRRHENNNNKETASGTNHNIPRATNLLLLSRLQDLLGRPGKVTIFPSSSTSSSSKNQVTHAQPGDDNNNQNKEIPKTTTPRNIHYPEASWRAMLLQQAPVQRLGVWTLDASNCTSYRYGFEMKTEMLEFQGGSSSHNQDDGLTMGWLVQFLSSKKDNSTPGCLEYESWELFLGSQDDMTGAGGLSRLGEREQTSLFVLKSARKERQALAEMWRTADVVLKLTRWRQGCPSDR